MNSGHRLEWVDAVKGFAILLVMWGHVQDVSPLWIWITSYHVPVFLFCTGYLYAARGRKMIDIKKMVKKLLYPYLTFSAIAIVAQFIYMFVSYGALQAMKITALNLYKTLCGFGINAIWFIPSYFIAVVTFFMLLRKNRIITIVSMMIIAALGVLTEFILSGFKGTVGSIVYSLISYPVLAIVRGIVCCIFIGGGIACITFQNGCTVDIIKRVGPSICAVSFVY